MVELPDLEQPDINRKKGFNRDSPLGTFRSGGSLMSHLPDPSSIPLWTSFDLIVIGGVAFAAAAAAVD